MSMTVVVPVSDVEIASYGRHCPFFCTNCRRQLFLLTDDFDENVATICKKIIVYAKVESRREVKHLLSCYTELESLNDGK